jgi:NitT/TauT family transport system substrate-binding protein
MLPSFRIHLILAALTVASCSKAPAPVEAKPLPKLSFITDWFAEAEHGGYYAATLNNYWKEEGIDVDVSSAFAQGMGGGTVEKRVSLNPRLLGITRADSVLEAVKENLPVIAVSPTLQHDPLGFLIHDESPVRDFKDLDGLPVSIHTSPLLFFLNKKYGLKHMKVYPLTGSIANFLVDKNWVQEGLITYQPYVAQKAGVKTRFLLHRDSGFDPYIVVLANKALVKEHPEWIRAFNRAAFRGWKEYFRNPGPTNALMHKANAEMDNLGLEFALRRLKEMHLLEGDPAQGETLGAFQAKRWDTLHQQLLDLKILEKPLDLSLAYTAEFTPDKIGIDPSLTTP